MRLGPKGYWRLPDTFRVVSSTRLVVSSGDTLNLQCPTLTILDTRQWASMWKKSLAHKDRPLAQKKNVVQKKHVGYRNFMTPYHFQTEIVCSYGKCRFANLWTLLFEDTQVHSQFIFPSMNCSHGYVLFQLGWKLLAGFNIALHLLFMLCLVPW